MINHQHQLNANFWPFFCWFGIGVEHAGRSSRGNTVKTMSASDICVLVDASYRYKQGNKRRYNWVYNIQK